MLVISWWLLCVSEYLFRAAQWRALFPAWGWRAASLYALLTGFHAPTPTRVRFAAARPREALTVRLAVVFAPLGVLRCDGVAIVGAISLA